MADSPETDLQKENVESQENNDQKSPEDASIHEETRNDNNLPMANENPEVWDLGVEPISKSEQQEDDAIDLTCFASWCMPSRNAWRKTLIFFLTFLCLWNLSKVPYYIQFDKNGESEYEKGGLTGSINLVYWVDGFQSSKLHSPACNFLLVHIAFGVTVLIMMAMTLIKVSWRRKYGYYFFTFAILLSVHTVPAAWTMGKDFTKYLFTFTCVWCFVAAIFGYRTLRNYDKDPLKAEKELAWEYGLITVGAYGAGFAEFSGILAKFLHKARTGVFQRYDELDTLFGNSVYDKLPESVGMTIFLAWVGIVWFWWPIKLLPRTNVNENLLVR